MTTKLTAASPDVLNLIRAWNDNQRTVFARVHPTLNFDDGYAMAPVERRKYLALDANHSGRLLVDRSSGNVYTIKAYGVPNRLIGDVHTVAAQFDAATQTAQVTR